MRCWRILLLIVLASLLAAPARGQELPDSIHPQAGSDDRLVAKEASLRLLVADTPKALQAIQNILDRYGGQTFSNLEWTVKDQGRTFQAASLSLRLPVEEFEPALLAVRQVALAVQAETVTGSDLTEEYVDLESNYRFLENERQRLIILRQEAATETELQRTLEDLEVLEARMDNIYAQLRDLEDRIYWASLALELQPFIPTVTPSLTPSPPPTLTPTPWDPAFTYRQAIQDRQEIQAYLLEIGSGGWQFFLLCCLPIFAIWIGWRLWSKRAGRSKS